MTTKRCKFEEAWIGRCAGFVTIEDSEYCVKHAAMKCAGCQSQATRSCDRTGVQFVCGAPLCDNCTGTEDPSAGFGLLGFGGHSHAPIVKKEQQL